MDQILERPSVEEMALFDQVPSELSPGRHFD